jgi:cytochrome P450
VWLPQNDLFAMGRYEDVRNALRDHKTFSSAYGVAANEVTNRLMRGVTLASDPPEHTEMRAALSAPLLPNALKQHQERIDAAARTLIDQLVERETFDAIADLARFLPLTIISHLVGLPEDGRQNMLIWASAAFDGLGPANQHAAAAQAPLQEMRDYVRDCALEGRLAPDGWTGRLYQMAEGGALDRQKCFAMMRDYVGPSLDTTISATGELIYQLAANDDVWQQIRRDPALIPGAVDEAVRLGSPVFSFTRYVTQPCDIDNAHLDEGARVAIVYASANRDERFWPDPDAFDPTRNRGKQLGFGNGVHMCAGMHLARLEMQALLQAMISRVEHIVVTGPTTRVRNNIIRAFETLPVQFISS